MQGIVLAIENSNPGAGGPGGADPSTCGVAVGRLCAGSAVEPLGTEPVAPATRHEDDLMAAVARLFDRCGLAPREIAVVAVSVGPGGYTALRIAVATAKLIAESCGAACVSVPTATALALRAPADSHGHGLAVALASKGESAHVTVFPASTGLGAGEPRLMSATDIPSLSAMGVRTLIADRHLPAKLREAACGAAIRVSPAVFDPLAVLELGAQLPRIDPVALLPIYPREPEAVLLWRDKARG